MESCINAHRRVGTTATLKNAKTHRFTIIGLFTEPFQYKEYYEMVEEGLSSMTYLKVLTLEHENKPDKKTYHGEIDLILSNEKRNDIIIDQIKDNQNTIILVDRVEDHMLPLKNKLEKRLGNSHKIFEVYQEVKDREYIRKYAEENDGVVIVATYKILSTGVNIKNIQHIILAASTKSEVRIPQTIGRGVRLDGKENILTVTDIVDIVRPKRYVYEHAKERLKIYREKGYDIEFLKKVKV